MSWSWLDYLREINIWSIILRIVLAMIIGGILGMERGRKRRPAGFRTYMLVSVGSALVMMTNQYVFTYYGVSDPVRMGAQVVSGIGFLGAGTIIVTGRNQVKGITTAAGLWTAACSGLAIGIGFYEGALIGGIAIFVIMAFMQKLDDRLHRHTNEIEVYVEYEAKQPFSVFLEAARGMEFDVSEIQLSKNKLAKGTTIGATMAVKTLTKRSHEEMVELLGTIEGVQHLEEI